MNIHVDMQVYTHNFSHIHVQLSVHMDIHLNIHKNAQYKFPQTKFQWIMLPWRPQLSCGTRPQLTRGKLLFAFPNSQFTTEQLFSQLDRWMRLSVDNAFRIIWIIQNSNITITMFFLTSKPKLAVFFKYLRNPLALALAASQWHRSKPQLH